MRDLPAEADRLWSELQQRDEREDERSLPLCVRLAQVAPAGSEAWAYAHRRLASRLLPDDPWRASVLARRVVRERRDDHAAWGLLGLSLSLLGHHRCAARAYREALARDPWNPSYAHNLGHLYDALLDSPDRGVELLRRAFAATGGRVAEASAHAEIAASYAHALMRVGQLERARAHMREVVKSRWARAEHHELYRQILEQSDAALAAHRPAMPAPAARRVAKRRSTAQASGAKRTPRAAKQRS
jgi:Flp pilus assembly protein TadD